MNLNDIFDALSYGELRQLYAGSGDAGLVGIVDRPKLTNSIALGLTDLYTRFLLKEGRIQVDRIPGRFTYPLTTQYAQSNNASQVVNKHINDLSFPFLDDLLKVHRLYDDIGEAIALNEIDNKQSIRTTSMTTLYIPAELETTTIDVVYHASHPAINYAVAIAQPKNQIIELPEAYLPALLLYVASRVMNPVGAGGQFHEGNNYAAKYEGACALLENRGMAIDTYEENTRFTANGWR